MKVINLRPYTDVQILYFINKFKENGWRQEDLQYITKKTDLQEWPLGIVFYPELLEYTDDGSYGNILTPWIVGKLEIEETDDLKLKAYKSFILDELESMNIHPFHDEDAYYEYFSKESHKGWTKLKFYCNKYYPNGYSENHTL